jgi:hypothetical protein
LAELQTALDDIVESWAAVGRKVESLKARLDEVASTALPVPRRLSCATDGHCDENDKLEPRSASPEGPVVNHESTPRVRIGITFKPPFSYLSSVVEL